MEFTALKLRENGNTFLINASFWCFSVRFVLILLESRKKNSFSRVYEFKVLFPILIEISISNEL